MIKKIVVESFKSLEKVEVELGILNVFVGANGSGKSNLLEAIGVLSAAAGNSVNDQTLLQRGVRPGVPRLYKSAFPTSTKTHIRFTGSSDRASYAVSLNNPLKDPSPAWKFKSERLERDQMTVASQGPNSANKPNKEFGLAALKIAELKETDPATILMTTLRDYVIYSPTTSVLRGIAPETQPRQPLGLSGGRLPEAVLELVDLSKRQQLAADACQNIFDLIDWMTQFGSSQASELLLSPAASSSSHVVEFKDRFMKKGSNMLSGYDASEGALYVLFLAILAVHPRAPRFCAVDNADHGLNPGLAKAVFAKLSDWILRSSPARQILLTTHNPAVLDGLPIQDDRIRLFTVDRDNKGRTIVKRVEYTEKMKKWAEKGWTLSRLWTNKMIGGMPDV